MEGTFINQAKYFKEFLKKFDMEKSNTISTRMGTSCNLDKEENEKKQGE